MSSPHHVTWGATATSRKKRDLWSIPLTEQYLHALARTEVPLSYRNFHSQASPVADTTGSGILLLFKTYTLRSF